jgi:DNA-binding transcriptional MerR regulator
MFIGKTNPNKLVQYNNFIPTSCPDLIEPVAEPLVTLSAMSAVSSVEPARKRLYRVKEAADMAGVSIRTLHHYDQIGLLKPEFVSPVGYRLYTEHNLEMLQQILFFKELGFSLQEIKKIITSPGFDRKQALKVHQSMLLAKKQRLEQLIHSAKKTLQALEGERTMSKQEMFSAFDISTIERHKAQYAAETKIKYGQTTACRESEQHTTGYTIQDWATIMHRGDEIHRKLATLMDKPAHAREVQVAIGEWRTHITNYYYPCTLDIFRELGDLYVKDKRFMANIDKYKSGLAKFMRQAMIIYCEYEEKKVKP